LPHHLGTDYDPAEAFGDAVDDAQSTAAPEGAARKPVFKGEFRILGILSIGVGVLLFLEQLDILTGVHKLWPIFPAFVGSGLVLLFFRRSRHDLLLLGMGAYLLVASAVFFICNFTSWSFLSQAWPLFVALLGLVSVLASAFAGKTRRVLWLSGLFLIIVAFVLFLVFTVNAKLWPISLVLFGTWVLLVTRAPREMREDHE
jgi:hypothetical protein